MTAVLIRNYLVTALRNIIRHKLSSIINLAGLALGLCCVIFVILFVRNETSYDGWLSGTEGLYRLEETFNFLGGHAPAEFSVVPFPLPEAMKSGLPEVTAMTRLVPEVITVNAGNRQFSDTIDAVDANFLDVIPLHLLKGDRRAVLSQPQSLVISQSLAKKYFGDADPIGKTVTVGNPNCADGDEACLKQTIALTVSGVMADIPRDSQLRGDALMPNASLADRIPKATKNKWMSFVSYGFVRLAPGADAEAVLRKTQAMLDQNLASQANAPARPPGGHVMDIRMTPFRSVHLDSAGFVPIMTPSGSWATVIGVGVIGILILITACFNFMNLATAQALLRAREIALRKCVGARRGQLIVQFLSEAVLMALLAAVLAVGLAILLLPLFNSVLGQQLSFDPARDGGLLLFIAAIAVAAGLIGGFYPALVLSGFSPAQGLKSAASSPRLRGALVVLQFAVSIGLGIAMLVVFAQINYARNIDLGFRHDRTLILAGGANLSPESRQSFTEILRGYPGVADSAMSNLVPFQDVQRLSDVTVPGQPGQINLSFISIDPDFARFYHISLLAGRMFSPDHALDAFSDTEAADNEGHRVVLNASAAARLGWTPGQAVGKALIADLDKKSRVQVIGVLADARFMGARTAARPAIYFYDKDQNTEFSIRVHGNDISATLAFIDRSWRRFAPMAAVNRHFLDDSFNRLYAGDQRQGDLFGIFVAIAVFIAALGLFGLAAFVAARRTREIGIRKLLGARTADVLWLLLWQFSIPVLIANAIAWPFAWFYLHRWLEGFANRIPLSPIYFIAAGLMALLIAWTVILVHALSVARTRPAEALRYE